MEHVTLLSFAGLILCFGIYLFIGCYAMQHIGFDVERDGPILVYLLLPWPAIYVLYWGFVACMHGWNKLIKITENFG